MWSWGLHARLCEVDKPLEIVESTHEFRVPSVRESGYDHREGGLLHAPLRYSLLCKPMFAELTYLLHRYHLHSTNYHLRLADGLCQQPTEFDSPFPVHASWQ